MFQLPIHFEPETGYSRFPISHKLRYINKNDHSKAHQVLLLILSYTIPVSLISQKNLDRPINPTMPIRSIAVARPEEAYHPDALRAALAEFISTLIFVFAEEGSRIAFTKLTGDAAITRSGLVAAALALFVAVSVAANVSGGHVNPAVTFGAFIGCNISLLRGILYWITQLLGVTVACLLLKFVTNG